MTQAACYFPNGIDMKADDKTFNSSLCGSDKEFNMCCAAGNSCRPDGLCFVDSTGLVYRKGCTDPTWTSPNCVKLCYTGLVSTDDKYVDMAASPVAVTLCRNGSYCCGNGTLADACCTMDQGLFVVNGSATQRNPAFTVASPTATFSESSSSLTPPASYPAQKSARETGTIVGGTIGGVALLALCVSIWKFLDRRKPQGHENEVVQTHAVSCPSTLSGPQDEENLHEPFEVHEDTEIREIDGAEVIFQLDPSRTPASRASGTLP